MRRARLDAVCVVSCALLLGCSSSSPSAKATPDAGCMPFTSTADLTVATSFAAGVAPIFSQNCTTGGARCHGDTVTLPFLGLPDASADPSTVIANIVGVMSDEDPSMPFVTAGDPSQSYLMYKVDGDQCVLAAQCAASPLNGDIPDCGSTMPFLATQLPLTSRDSIRRWIAQGAQNN